MIIKNKFNTDQNDHFNIVCQLAKENYASSYQDYVYSRTRQDNIACEGNTAMRQ